MVEKRIIVTGATRGIGKAIAEKFLAQGFTLCFCGTNQDKVNALCELWRKRFGNDKVHALAVNLMHKDEVLKFAQFALNAMQGCEILVNNAGVFLPGSALEEEEGVFETMIQVNLAAAYHLTRAIVPQMKNLKFGHLFNICSTASITAYINGGSYCISKFGLLGMTKVLREELKGSQIAVTAVIPGATLTDSWGGSDLPNDRFMRPDEVAEAIFNAYGIAGNTVIEEIILRPRAGDI